MHPIRANQTRGTRCLALASLIGMAACGLFVTGVDAVEKPPAFGSPKGERSPRPSPRQWREAQRVALSEVRGERASACQAFRVREWLKVSCPDLPTAALRLVGGEAKDAYFEIEAKSLAQPTMPGGGSFEVAVRPGDARVIQFWSFGPGYDGPLTVMGSITFQQSWLEGESAPYLILTDVLHEPIRTATQDGK